MKQLIVMMVFGLVGLSDADAATEESSMKTVDQKGNKKSTNLNFEDILVQGKYHFGDESVTTVEQDKVLDALLGVRTDFKDRIKKSTGRF